MPTYGDDKIKDMIESLLPSSARRIARETRRATHRKARRRYKQNPAQDNDIERKRKQHISYMKRDRRAADKLSFVRWAEERTKHLEDGEDRYNYVKALVPDNTIGRHALTHIDFLLEGDGRRYTGYKQWKAQNREYWRQHQEELGDTLRALLVAPGGHRELNRAIKRAHNRLGHMQRRRASMYVMEDAGRIACEYCYSPRTLAGMHDVDAFVKDIFKNGDHREWREAVETFIAGWRPV